ncbi:unnamed protein product, partial [Amoebophrya sp. A120]
TEAREFVLCKRILTFSINLLVWKSCKASSDDDLIELSSLFDGTYKWWKQKTVRKFFLCNFSVDTKMRSGSRVMLSCTPAGGFGRFLLFVLGSLLGSFWGTTIGPSNAAFALAMTPAASARTLKRTNKDEESSGPPPGSTSKKDQSVLSRPRSSPASQEPAATPRPQRCKKIGTVAAATMGLAAATTGLAALIGNSSPVVGTTPAGLGQAPADASRWSEGGTEPLAREQTCNAFPYTDPCVVSVPFGADVRSACRNDRQKETGGEKIEPLRVCHAKAVIDPNHGKATLEPANFCARSSASTSSLEIAEIGFFKDCSCKRTAGQV